MFRLKKPQELNCTRVWGEGGKGWGREDGEAVSTASGTEVGKKGWSVTPEAPVLVGWSNGSGVKMTTSVLS